MTLILILVLLSFLQSALSFFQIILLALIARSFLVSDRKNYWLAFGLGLLLTLLTDIKLGSLSVVYILTVVLVYFVKERSVGSHWWVLLPVTMLMLGVDSLIKMMLLGSSLDIFPILWQTVLILPVYFCLKIWEERFVVKKEIRLKVRK